MNQNPSSFYPHLNIGVTIESAKLQMRNIFGEQNFASAIETDALAPQQANFGSVADTPRGQYELICYRWTRHIYHQARELAVNTSETKVDAWREFRETMKTQMVQPLQDIFLRDDIGLYHAKDTQLFCDLERYLGALNKVLECVDRELKNAMVLENYINIRGTGWKEAQELKQKHLLPLQAKKTSAPTGPSSKYLNPVPENAAQMGDSIFSARRMPLPSARGPRAPKTDLSTAGDHAGSSSAIPSTSSFTMYPQENVPNPAPVALRATLYPKQDTNETAALSTMPRN